MKCFTFCLVLICIYHSCNGAMTEAQVKSAGKLMRNVCQPKSKATDEQIENTHNGKWEEDKNLMCYFKCILQMTKILNKNGEYQLEAGLSQIPQLPEPRREPTKKTMTACQNAAEGETDKCIIGFKTAQCIYNDNPENYFLP